MPHLKKYKLLLLTILILMSLLVYSLRNETFPKPQLVPNLFSKSTVSLIDPKQQNARHDRIVLSIVVCDARFNESLTMIKSVLVFTKVPIYFVIFADDILRPQFDKQLHEWKKKLNGNFDFRLKEIKFPEKHKKDWLNLFNKCAAQRLFIPNLVEDVDAMIYTDTDTLFLGPVEDLWKYFYKFNETQIAALVLENEDPNVSWYPRFAKHPFYGRVGLNSGVMLMNLTRMREFHWVDYVTPIMLKWKLAMPWGDQDIINVIFHYRPSGVHVLPCRYNFRTEQCAYGDACPGATKYGALVLHGSRKAFHSQSQPAFKAIYTAFEEFRLGLDTPSTLAKYLRDNFANLSPSNCANLPNAFLKLPLETLNVSVIPIR